MKRYQRTTVSQYLVIALIIGAVIGVGFLSFFVMSNMPFVDHFAIPWAAGRTWLLEGQSPYSLVAINAASVAIEEGQFLAEMPSLQLFTQPLISLVFYLPLSLIPYTISRVIWVTILSLSIGMIGILGLKLTGWKLPILGRILIIILLVFWLPSTTAILGGYLSPIIIALLLVSILLMINNQDTTAGFLLALTFSSFPTSGLILIMVLIWSISHRRWSILSSYFSGVLFLVVISFLILPTWFRDWASVLLNLSLDWGWINTPLMDLADLLPGIAQPLSVFLHIVFGVYALVLIISLLGQSGRIFIYKTFSLMIIAYLLHIQGSIVFLPFVFPALLLVCRFWAERWGKIGNLFSWLVLFLVGAGSWLLVYEEIDFTILLENPLLTIGFPIFVLLGMIWIRWWALSIPKFSYEKG